MEYEVSTHWFELLERFSRGRHIFSVKVVVNEKGVKLNWALALKLT